LINSSSAHQQVREELESMGCQIKTSCEIKSVSSSEGGTANARSSSRISSGYHLVTHPKQVIGIVLFASGFRVTVFDGSEETYDRIIFGVHAPDALKILGAEATHEELRILGAFQYVYR
jgi:cyclopropane-fatty-acyl-phospholipid synthase